MKSTTVYQTRVRETSCYHGDRDIWRMALHPMDRAPDNVEDKRRRWGFRVAFDVGRRWAKSCMGRLTEEEMGGDEIGDGGDVAALRWLWEGEK